MLTSYSYTSHTSRRAPHSITFDQRGYHNTINEEPLGRPIRWTMHNRRFDFVGQPRSLGGAMSRHRDRTWFAEPMRKCSLVAWSMGLFVAESIISDQSTSTRRITCLLYIVGLRRWTNDDCFSVFSRSGRQYPWQDRRRQTQRKTHRIYTIYSTLYHKCRQYFIFTYIYTVKWNSTAHSHIELIIRCTHRPRRYRSANIYPPPVALLTPPVNSNEYVMGALSRAGFMQNCPEYYAKMLNGHHC